MHRSSLFHVLCRAMEKQVCETQSILQQKEFYEDAARYWEKIPPTVDGMLGGFGFISQTDISGSRAFLKSLFQVAEFEFM